MKLSVLKRNQLIQKIDLSQEVLTFDYSETIFLIGRSKDCHVVLDDKQISREHSKFIYQNGKWTVEIIAEDSQPLQVNGVIVKRSEIKAGDQLTIGSFTILIDELSTESDNKEINLSNSVKTIEEIVEVKPKAEPEPKVQTVVSEAPKIEITKEQKIAEVVSDDSTREIDVNTIVDSTKEIPFEVNSSENSSAINDDFNFDDSINDDLEQIVDSSEAVEEIAVENSEGIANEATAYSLENIDSGDSDNDSTRVMQSFASVHLDLFGETAPYDKFILEKDKTYIGRDPSKCQIVLNDSEVSTVHALITKNNIMISLEDLNSGNGTLLNGNRVNKAQLNHNDEFVIGGVTFTIKFRSEFLAEEHSRLMPVDENQTVDVEEVIEVPAEEGETLNAFGEVEEKAPPEKSIIKRIWKDENSRKKLIYGVVLVVGAWFMLDDDKAPPKPKAKESVEKTKDGKTPTGKDVVSSGNDPKKSKLSEEQRRKFSEYYQVGKNHFDNGRYRDALEEFDKINSVDPYFNNALPSLISTAKEGLKRLEEQERKRREEEALAERKLKIKKLLEEAKKYTEEHNSDLANETFQKITTLDPENFEVATLRRTLKSWEDEKRKKELEEATKKSEREAKVKKLSDGKTLFLRKDWYHAIARLDEFLKITSMDEDLIKEASEMLRTSKEEINAAVNPLLGKAKSLQEGQDLKGAYEIYQQVLKYEPSNTEALAQTGEIKETLNVKARKIYREAIISESLSLFQDAKEKFQEVQQISPVDSDYYKKASEKLKDYLE